MKNTITIQGPVTTRIWVERDGLVSNVLEQTGSAAVRQVGLYRGSVDSHQRAVGRLHERAEEVRTVFARFTK